MKNNIMTSFIIGLLLAVTFVGVNAFYIVDETEQVVITQFGEPVGGPINKAGLHVKLPIIQQVNRFEKRILEWDGDPNQVPTRDKRYIWVDTIARWRIVDPLMFLQSMGTESLAQARLNDILDAATRDAISRNNLIEVIRSTNDILSRQKNVLQEEKDELSFINLGNVQLDEIKQGREALTREILKRASVRLNDFGIELVDIRIRRINYVSEVLRKVFERMISERKRAAEQYRSEGQGEKAEIEGKKKRELQEIQSEAYRKAQEVKGRADAEAIKIYADAYNRDPKFYAFLKTLETYRKTIDKDTTLLLSTDSELYRFFKSAESSL